MDKKRVVGYIRVSTKGQAVEGYSLENQKKDIIDRCKKEGYELVDIYEDAGISGASIEGRDGFKNLLKDVKYGKVDCVVVWKLSRLSRSLHDAVNILKFLDENRVSLISISDNINTFEPTGKMFMYMVSIFSEIERDNIIMQVKGGMREKARQGEWNGGIPPLGYDLINKKLMINKENAEIVKSIYSKYIAGNGYKSIAEELNDNGYKTVKEKRFSAVSVKNILTNIIYIGRIRWGKLDSYGEKNSNGKRHRRYNDEEKVVNVKGKHEAIIDEDVFSKVQQMIKSNSRHNVKRFNGYHLLSGVLRCPQCGGAMSIQCVKSKGRDYFYYTCNKYVNKKECKANNIPKVQIEKEFFSIFEKMINEESFKEQLVDSYNNISDHIEDMENNIKRKEKEIKALESNNKNSYKELTVGSDDYKNMVRVHIEENLKKIRENEAYISGIKNEINKIREKDFDAQEICEMLECAGNLLKLMDKEAQQNLIRRLISSIEVENKHIKSIKYTFDKSFIIKGDTVNRTINK